jgi:hypothetical protein
VKNRSKKRMAKTKLAKLRAQANVAVSPDLNGRPLDAIPLALAAVLLSDGRQGDVRSWITGSAFRVMGGLGCH